MEIENLNKTQILLLTLLTSFVTSIATGIVTVSLLEQAPAGVTQTINRVVERTVEKVVPAQAASVITKETTVIVKEEDVVAQSIEKNFSNIVGVYKKVMGTDGIFSHVFLGWGIVLTSNGFVGTDSDIISDDGLYVLKDASGKVYESEVVDQDESIGVAIVKAVLPEKTTLTAVTFGDVSKLKLGQNVIAFGGKEKLSVSVGVVSALESVERTLEGSTTTETRIGYIDSNIDAPQATHGGPLITIFGEVVGIRAGLENSRFVSERLLRDFLSKNQPSPKTTEVRR